MDACLQVYTNKSHLLDEAHDGASDDEDGRGPKMVYFDLKVTHYDPFPSSDDEEHQAHGAGTNYKLYAMPPSFAYAPNEVLRRYPIARRAQALYLAREKRRPIDPAK